MSRKVEELLKNMEMWGTPTAAYLHCYESEDGKTEKISTILYEIVDGYGEGHGGEELEISKKNEVVSVLVKDFGFHRKPEPFDKLEAEILMKILGTKIQQAKEILKTLQTAKEWLEK